MAVHGMEAGYIAGCVVRQPDDSVRNKLHTGGEGIVRKEFQKVCEPPDSSIPTVRSCERGSFVWRGHQNRVLHLESPCEAAELTGFLNKRSNDQATPRVRDHIETRRLIR